MIRFLKINIIDKTIINKCVLLQKSSNANKYYRKKLIKVYYILINLNLS